MKIMLERDSALRCTYIYRCESDTCDLYGCPTPSAEHREIGVVRDNELEEVVRVLTRLLEHRVRK
jgi:hypothetical protein